MTIADRQHTARRIASDLRKNADDVNTAARGVTRYVATWLDARLWTEYDAAAEWCARRGLKGNVGDALPSMLAADVLAEINADPDAFGERVRATAYMLAMEAIEPFPLCVDCASSIGGAHGGPDAPWRAALPGEACGAADHGGCD